MINEQPSKIGHIGPNLINELLKVMHLDKAFVLYQYELFVLSKERLYIIWVFHLTNTRRFEALYYLNASI